MTDRVSCTVSVLHVAGEPHRLWRSSELCHDCSAPRGALHHIGCDMQRCPCCREQLLGCGCIFDEDLEDPTTGAFVGQVVRTYFDDDHEPGWEPLAAVALAARRDASVPSFHEGEFMYMGTAVDDSDGEEIHLYKHCDTRRHLNLDDFGRAYGYRGRLDHHGGNGYECYQRYASLDDALAALQLRLFLADPPLFRSFPPSEWPADPPEALSATL